MSSVVVASVVVTVIAFYVATCKTIDSNCAVRVSSRNFILGGGAHGSRDRI